ncbi:unnamed protein product [Brassica oleracea var. botrytis]
MQVVSPLSPATRFVGEESFAELYGKLNDDFSSKLKVGFKKEEEEEEEKNRDGNNLEKSWWNQDDDEGEEGEDEEFSFTSVNADNSPITADEAFKDGQIRPVYPLFNRNLLFEPEERSLRSPLKKLFVESEEAAATEREEESEPMGPYCSWSGRTVVEEASPETCRKSSSTGFSKLWRFRDLVSRSNSDGKDAFVFLNHGDKKKQSSSKPAAKLSGGVKRTETKTRSAHERLYMRNRAIREEGKRRSYLPYKHVGFFTNVNGLTRNVLTRGICYSPPLLPLPPNISEKPYWGVQDEGSSGSEGDNSDDEDEDKKGLKSINPAHVPFADDRKAEEVHLGGGNDIGGAEDMLVVHMTSANKCRSTPPADLVDKQITSSGSNANANLVCINV